MNASEPTPEFLAARVALLALRSSLDQPSSLDADRVVLAPSNVEMSRHAAAQMLAAKPKPLFCGAEAHEDRLVVSCRSRLEADTIHRQHGGFMGYLQDQYGPSDHLVAVFGADDSLIVPQSVVQRWLNEYEIDAVGYSIDDIDNPWGESDPDHVEAKRSGAKGVLRFAPAVTPDYFTAVSVTGGANQLTGEVEDHLVQMTRMSHGMLRLVVDSSAGLTAGVSDEHQRKNLDVAKQQLRQRAEMLRQVFKGRTMPPDVAAFIKDCEKYLGHQQ